MTLLLLFAALLPLGAQEREPYAWPLDLPRVLTSSFAEYREGRFHMGIDLRTGPPGQDVHAALDGHVSRLRCSPYGYGKAVYVTLNDGNTAVYAHLSDFAPPLRQFLRAAQHARKSYSVDLYPGPQAFPVKRGEIIAKSGQTGIGVPHLHYEIRDPDGNPLNPRKLGIEWPDDTPPRIRKVLLLPADPTATLNGDLLPLILPVRRAQDGTYRTDPVRATGALLLGVDLSDTAAPASPRLGIHTVRSSIGGRDLFLLMKDTLSYAHSRDGLVAYHPYFLDRGRFLLPWRWPGSQSEIFQATAADGRIPMPQDPTDLTLVALDFLGNAATLTIPLLPDSVEAHRGPIDPSAIGGTGRVEVECFGQWLLATVSFPRGEGQIPLLLSEADTIHQEPFHRIDANTFRAAYAPPLSGACEVLLSVAHPRVEPFPGRFLVVQRGQGDRRVELAGLRMHIRSHSPYGVLFLRVDALDPPAVSSQPFRGKAYRIWHPHAPIDEPITLSLPVPEGAPAPSRLLVYRETPDEWIPETTVHKGDRLEIATRRLGTFAVKEDTRPPTIRIAAPADGAVLRNRRPPIRVAIDDPGGAVAHFAATANGDWLLMEYDPERKLLYWSQDIDLPLGQVTLAVTVRDTAGNEAEERRDVTITPSNGPRDPKVDAP